MGDSVTITSALFRVIPRYSALFRVIPRYQKKSQWSASRPAPCLPPCRPSVRFAHLGYNLGQFPVAEYMGLNGIHVGVHQNVGIEEMEYLLEMLDTFIKVYL